MQNNNNYTLKQIIYRGAILRFSFLIFVLIMKEQISPYLLLDDEMFESIALNYLKSSHTVFDFSFAEGLRFSGTSQSFWHYFMCFSSEFFGCIYIARIFNCIISTGIIYLVYTITKNICEDESMALFSAKLYAYIPYMWIFCAFPFKDVLLSFFVFYIINEFVKIQKINKIDYRQILIISIFSICIYYIRGGVIEFMALMAIAFVSDRFVQEKKYLYIVLICLFVGVLFLNMKEFIENAAMQKIEDYNTIENISSGKLSYIQIYTISDLWKLPFTYFFSILQPMMLKVYTYENFNWYTILCLSNLALYPIAIGNIIYAVRKKYNNLFWITTFIMYACVISLSLQTFRHYYFLYPLSIINYACIKSYHNDVVNKIIYFGSIILALAVFIFSF